MAEVMLGDDGQVIVIRPPTPAEVAEAEEALGAVIKALAEMAWNIERQDAGRGRL